MKEHINGKDYILVTLKLVSGATIVGFLCEDHDQSEFECYDILAPVSFIMDPQVGLVCSLYNAYGVADTTPFKEEHVMTIDVANDRAVKNYEYYISQINQPEENGDEDDHFGMYSTSPTTYIH